MATKRSAAEISESTIAAGDKIPACEMHDGFPGVKGDAAKVMIDELCKGAPAQFRARIRPPLLPRMGREPPTNRPEPMHALYRLPPPPPPSPRLQQRQRER